MEIPRCVEKIGGSWVIKLDAQTRKLLNAENIGDIVLLKKASVNNNNEEDLNTY